MRLNLDGVNDLKSTVSDYGARPSSFKNGKTEVHLRITALVHTVLTMIRTISVQFCRGTGEIISGGVHWKKENVLEGLKDYLSIVVQTATLPIFGLIVTIYPQGGYEVLDGILSNLDSRTRGKKNLLRPMDEYPEEDFHMLRKGISDAVMGVLGSVSALFRTLTDSAEKLVAFQTEKALEILKKRSKLIILAPTTGFASCCSIENTPEHAYLAHRVELCNI